MSNSARARVVQEALSWQGTRYHHRGRIKGVGVDCGMILAEVYERAGVWPHQDPGAYPHDWHLHRGEEWYRGMVEQLARPVAEPRPGDIAIWHFGHCFSHGAVVIDWPRIVHAYLPARAVVLDDAQANQDLASREVLFFSPWED